MYFCKNLGDELKKYFKLSLEVRISGLINYAYDPLLLTLFF